MAPPGPGTSPALFQGFPSSAVDAGVPVAVRGWEHSVLNEGTSVAMAGPPPQPQRFPSAAPRGGLAS